MGNIDVAEVNYSGFVGHIGSRTLVLVHKLNLEH